MALDLLLVVTPLIVTVFFLFVLTGNPLPTSDGWIYPPNPLHPWKGKHPNGDVSTIEKRKRNENNIMIWKLRGYNQPIPAEPGFDVFTEDGAEAGQPSSFFFFRFNPDGSEQEYSNPSMKQYFSIMDKKKQLFKENIAGKERSNEYKEKSRNSLSRSLEDSMDTEYAENVYSMDSKMLQALLNRRGGNLNNAEGMDYAEKTVKRKE